MRDIVRWLAGVEKTASAFYAETVPVFREEDGLGPFLHHLAKDEGWHLHLMNQALQLLEQHGPVEAAFVLDERTQARVEAPFAAGMDKLRSGALSRADLIDCIVQTEFSEWNYLFLYAVGSLRDLSPEFNEAVAQLQAHMDLIRDVLRDLPDGAERLADLEQTPAIWRATILVAEDSADLLHLYEKVLGQRWNVHLACNGEQALQMASAQYYDAIVTDLKMPKLDGLGLYRLLRKVDPTIADRIIFTTGHATSEFEQLQRSEGFRYLLKPLRLKELATVVEQVVGATRPGAATAETRPVSLSGDGSAGA